VDGHSFYSVLMRITWDKIITGIIFYDSMIQKIEETVSSQLILL
jgi:hypothetical protein